jgi:hypothetical protein
VTASSLDRRAFCTGIAIYAIGLCLSGCAPNPDRTVTVCGRPYQAEPLWTSNLSSPRAAADYVVEGTSQVAVRDGFYFIDARHGERHFATVWLPGNYPPNIRIRYVARCPAPAGARNINLFFHARLTNGRDVLDESNRRTGEYSQYHPFPNYILTYLGDDRLRVRMRRDPGFELLTETYLAGGVPLDTDIELEVRVADGCIEYHELRPHKRLLLRHHDPHPLTGGRVALRTWKTRVGYRDIRIDRLVPAH